MEYTLYNPGPQIEDTIPFSLSNDRGDQTIGKHRFRLPEKGYAKMATELDLPNGTTLRVEFPEDVIRKYGERGVTLVVSVHEKSKRFGSGEIPEHLPYATTEKEAKVKGDALWAGYTLKKAEDYIAETLESRAAGGRMRRAQGFTKFCLELHNLIDPADAAYTQQKGAGAADADLQKQIDDLRGMFGTVMATPGVKEALAKAQKAQG